MRSTRFGVAFVVLSTILGLIRTCPAGTVIGPEAKIAADSRQQFARYVTNTEADITVRFYE